jgi:hypothetical protein
MRTTTVLVGGIKVFAIIPGEGLDIPIWILGSSTDSAYFSRRQGLPYALQVICPCTITNSHIDISQ